jgi:uncharacterized protein YoaH (UPF0181 family)
LKPGFKTHDTAPASASGLDPQSARILGLFAQGMSIGEIVKAVWGDISGPKYNQARSQVETAIRVALTSVAA